MLDAPDADRRGLLKSLSYIRIMNKLLGYDTLITRHLERFSSNWKPGQTIRILDVGTGSADIPLTILKWAQSRGFDLRIVGLDLHPFIVGEAARNVAGHSRISIVRGDALRLPFADNSFDYATTSMFLHHLEESEVEQVLRNMDRVARRGLIVSDLLRLRRSYAFITLATLFATKMVRHDARVSIEQAFSQAEVLTLRDRAGIPYADYSNHLTHRFILAGEKPLASTASRA